MIGTHRKEDARKACAVPQAEERSRAGRVLCRERYWSPHDGLTPDEGAWQRNVL